MSESPKKPARSQPFAPDAPAPNGHQRATPRQGTSYMTAPGPLPAPDDPLLDFVPYLHKQPRRNSITPEKQRDFIAMLAATGIVARAAMHIGVSLEALYKLRQQPGAEGFAAAWEAAVDRGVDRIEAAAMERAIKGVPHEHVLANGDIVVHGAKHNENLVMFFLKNRRPEKYSAHLRPGNAVYERIRAEVLTDLMQQAERNRGALVDLIAAEVDALRATEAEARKDAE